MTSRFFLVFLVVISTIANGTLAADAEKPQPVDNKSSPADNSTKSSIDSLGPAQDYPDYEIPVELAPDGIEAVADYAPISPNGGLAQPEAEVDVRASQSSSASRSSSTVWTVVVAVAGGARLFFF
ncbi:Uncharacterized protein Rs2_14962 [Raphanus sativus]|uniref:Uncharacterized protein LOC108853734 n=1 Tax=Raphanus sativus TaxID=3726 RepID=A0A6J0NDQ8_RAPSA|nr:uncharacterized protein LOC108853734 [Raphanus sativus]KAJ4901011.1 Uncharacterized protein Rs2_14962 [Raphanus sativus]